jgi:hypothetical protein
MNNSNEQEPWDYLKQIQESEVSLQLSDIYAEFSKRQARQKAMHSAFVILLFISATMQIFSITTKEKVQHVETNSSISLSLYD